MYVLFLTGTLLAGQRLQKRLVVRQNVISNVISNLIPIFAVRGIRVHTSFNCRTPCAQLAAVLSNLVVVPAHAAVRAGGFRRASKLVVVLAGGAVRADAGAIDPVRPGGAARGGGDRATPFDTPEHTGLVGSTVDPSWTTEGGLIV